ncbi:RNA ligase [Roseibium sp. RKSG952]|uniref:RNA ligase n=1 Tax=Roseibium sp. RKSG952 TaxID=2529384 RepID=UPI0018AD2152
MRKLIVMRGHPGSGKTTLLRELGLEDWSLSADDIRKVNNSPMLTLDGRLIQNQDDNHNTFRILRETLESRMEKGQLIALDTTLMGSKSKKTPASGSTPPQNQELKYLKEIAHKHRYRICIADLSTFPVEQAIENNKGRPETRRVTEYRIREIHEGLNKETLDTTGIEYLQWDEEGALLDRLWNWIKEPVLDLSGYREVVHIGDLQGTFEVLTGPNGPLARGLRDDTAYVFVGDLLDRGIENGEILRWFVNNALDRNNVFLLWGNHEDHLHRWARGMTHVSNEFEFRTLPQLIKKGITRADADRVCNKAREFLKYVYDGRQVLVTHAGMPHFPEHPELISLKDFSKGVGNWEHPIDTTFDENTSEGYQVHGHRNHGSMGVQATPRSFNLEDSVEHGGFLRTCTLSRDGWTAGEYRNHVFRSLRERLALETVLSDSRKAQRKKYPNWILEDNMTAEDTKISEELLATMRAHSGVREKTPESHPHVSSLNFTNKVFYDKAWDDIVVKARGFFFNNKTREIISRGYEKFFNIGETEETSMEALAEHLEFPVTAYIKENGFLGNIGYDAETDSLFIASKSTPEGKFADYFRTIVESKMSERQLEELKRYLRDTESSMTFEVIDPVNDPHMIEYDEPDMILLDIIRRSSEFDKAPQEILERIGKKFDLTTKTQAMRFKDFNALERWMSNVTKDMNYRINGLHHEGVVLEDAKRYMTKVKFPYYSFWKQMRSMKDRIIRNRINKQEFTYEHTWRPDGLAPTEEEIALAHDFRDWCLQQGSETLEAGIIALRKEFGRDFDSDFERRSTLKVA